MNDIEFAPPPRIVTPLDPGFRPAILGYRAFQQLARKDGRPDVVQMAFEQSDGFIFHHWAGLFPADDPRSRANLPYLERLVKFLLWSRGAFRIHIAGPADLVAGLKRYYLETLTGRFDAQIMGERIYERPFEIVQATAGTLPRVRGNTVPLLGRHLDGCRIGFDLGGSDRKVAAVIDGRCVFSEEIVWNPIAQADPQWHFDQIMESLRRAAAHLPRIDAIGGSAAGVYVHNRVKVASLFRSVPAPLFESRVKNLFLELKQAWNGIPFEVVNDGEVTALAGSMTLGQNGVLGVAMGTSQAAGYVTPEGNITPWLNELAFAPVDLRADGPVDEWSGDHGCGALYFSQQAVGRLMGIAGIEAPDNLSLAEKLKFVQQAMERDDPRARRIFETIGVYLGYAIAQYKEYYSFGSLLLLGRVTSGEGGGVIVAKAEEVLQTEFPELASGVKIHMPDERDKRHGQAIAAASLPALQPLGGGELVIHNTTIKSGEEIRMATSTMNPYQKLVADYARFHRESKSFPLGGFPPAPRPSLAPDAPKVLLFSPHPDDECIIGGLALRFLREAGMRIVNVAITQGRIKERQEPRWAELVEACRYIGFDLVPTKPGGMERIVRATRENEPAVWKENVSVITRLLLEHRPKVLFFPHVEDWNSSHIGTHLLVVDALAAAGPEFECSIVETEFWGQMASPNLLVESSEQDVADLVTATSFHVGEVRRNPYHVLMPAWMQDNVRRGAELVGGQGTAAPDFIFATVYRLRQWTKGGWKNVLVKGRHLSRLENPATLFR